MNVSDEVVKNEAKMELVSITSELMPRGVPNLTAVIKYPTIDRLGQEVGKKGVLLMILMLVRDFCNSVNVVRNMNEDQMLETASMLLDECGNFRLEDYVMMFSLGKRGQLGKIFDRVDIDLISGMLDAYWEMRNKAGQRAQEEQYHDFETQLKEMERKPAELSKDQVEMQDGLLRKMRDLGEQMEETFKVDNAQEVVRRDARIKKMQENIYGSLSPDQKKIMDDLRRFSRKGWVPDDRAPEAQEGESPEQNPQS